MLLDRGLLVRSRGPLRAERTGRHARRPRVVAEPDRRAVGRAAARGADAASGRRGAGQDVLEAGDRGLDRPAGRTADGDPRFPGPQGAAVGPARPARHRPWPVRVPAIARAEDRVRHAVEEGPQDPTPRCRRQPRAILVGRRGRDRRGARLALRRGVPAGARRRRCPRDPGEGVRDAHAGRRTRPVPGRAARGANLLPARRRADRVEPGARGAEGAGRLHGRHQRARRRRHRRARGGRRSVRGRRRYARRRARVRADRRGDVGSLDARRSPRAHAACVRDR